MSRILTFLLFSKIFIIQSSIPAYGEDAAVEPPQAADSKQVVASTGASLESNSTCDEPPWYCGVGSETRAQTLTLYRKANQYFDNNLFVEAADTYRRAIELWEHPSIYYNLSLALIYLRNPIEAYESTKRALDYKGSALRPEQRRRAQDNTVMLRGQLTELHLACSEPGATVFVNGRPVLDGRGEKRLLLRPGPISVTAKKVGYLTPHASLLLLTESPKHVQVDMLRTVEASGTSRYWAVWKPWSMVGAAAGLGALGGLFQWRASGENRRFATLFEDNCPEPEGCLFENYTAAMRASHQRFVWLRRAQYGAYIAGGVAGLTGLVLAYLNRPRRWVHPRKDKLLTITPLVTESETGVALQGNF